MQTRLKFPSSSSLHALPSVDSRTTTVLPRHRWYSIKEAFSPSLVAHAIADSACEESEIVFDPFSGSGTVPLTSTIKGYRSIALEVNPFFAFAAEAKLQQCKLSTFDNYLELVVKGISKGAESPLETFSTFSEAGGAQKWLFNEAVLRAFEGGWQATHDRCSPARDILRLALIGAALDVANATKDGKCLRYRANWQDLGFGKAHFVSALQRRVADIREDLVKVPLTQHTTSVKVADARIPFQSAIPDDKFKLCIMSPPYLNSFDYTDVYRPELFLGKFVESQADLRALRLRTLRSHVQVKWKDPKESEFGDHFSESFERIQEQVDRLWDKRIPDMILAYFEDIKQVLTNLNQVAKRDASVWIVVSTSAYGGIEIPVDLIIADIACQVGWFLREITVARHLRRVPVQQWNKLSRAGNRPYLRESVIILDKEPKKV